MAEKYDLLYDGTTLHWYGVSTSETTFKATSGLAFKNDDGTVQDYRSADNQNLSDKGPIPEGFYSFSVTLAKDANFTGMDKSGNPQLDAREGIEHIPDTITIKINGVDEEYSFPGWGSNRVRLSVIRYTHPKDVHRAGGFYLHDSHKGYTHGCVEVGDSFFDSLRTYAQQQADLRKKGKKSRSQLILKVEYPSASATTYGGTLTP
jgi:hypothetical protein